VHEQEAVTARLAPADRFHRLGIVIDGPIPLTRIEDVDRNDLVGAATLHLERPEAVEAADVEAPLAAEICGKRNLADDGARVEPAGRDDPGRELERVVPLVLVDEGAEVVASLVGRRQAPTVPAVRRAEYRPAPAMSGPDVSVIVPVRNSAGTIGRALAALAAQEIDAGYEVIVVDDDSDDGTAELAGRAGGPVKVLRQGRSGPSAARNRGAAAAEAPALAFTDADCFPTPGWLAAGLSALGPADLVQGAVLPDPETVFLPFDRTIWVERETGLYETANLFVKKDVFERVGGFEEWLTPDIGKSFGEDIWFGWRARRAGARTAFSPEALVHHAVFPRGPAEYVDERRRLRYFPAAASLVPELRDTLFYRRLFLSKRTAAFDLAVAGAAVAAARRSPRPLAAALPYAWLAGREALRWRHRAPLVAVAGAAADAVGAASLARGSVRWRTPVL
jgi:GT2 family glycosyltransferase